MSSQIKNLKSQGAKENIKRLVILFFSLFLTLAVFFQISAAKPKPTYDVGLNKADWLYYKSSNDLAAYLGKKSSSLPTARYQKGGDYLEFSMTGVSSATAVSLETNTKTPNTPTLFYRNILDGVDANYQITKMPFRVKEEIVLQSQISNLKSQNLNFVFDAETSAKPVKQKDGSIAFFDNQNNYLFQLDKPFMMDAKLNRSEAVTIEIIPNDKIQTSNQFQNPNAKPNPNFKAQILKLFDSFGFGHLSLIGNLNFDIGHFETELAKQYQITLIASSDWLSTATYPVVIDPTVTHNADANFTGQMNRIADSDTTSSAQLESSYPEAVKDPHTVLLLHFNEANGTQTGIRDYASTTRVITANGNASTTSYVTQLGMGNSAAFDGTGDYLDIGSTSDVPTGNNGYSIEFWLNVTNYSTDFGGGYNGFIFSRGLEATNQGHHIAVKTDGSIAVTHFGNDVNTGFKINTNTWYHMVDVWDGVSEKLYVNGVLVNGNIHNQTLNVGNTNIKIGRHANANSYFLNGYLDDLRILKGRALTPEEIKAAASRKPYAVYTSPVLDASGNAQWDTLNWTEGGVATGNGEQPYSTNSLVAQWDFNDTSGTTLTASSSGSCTTSCNGTLTNFAYTSSQDQATTTTGWTANNKKWGAGALMFSGAATADYVSITDPASNVLDPNSADLTIETWIKTSDTSAEIFSNNNGNGTACTNNGYYLGIDASGYTVFYLDTNGATAGCDASTTSQFKINDGNWHKVSVSVTRGTSAVIYVDGKSAGSDTSVTSYSAITVTGNIFFGGSAGGLDAILDSARYYSRALSASEILSNYNAGNIEIQTRTGATSDPNDGTWEAWKPTTGETQLLSMDSDAANWHSDIMASTTIATSTETVIKAEGTGSLKIRTGMASTTAGTVALWHFEETGTTTGTYLYDETANNNDTTTGTTVVGGIFGKGRKFNGTSDYLSALDSANWAMGTGDFTFSWWMKFDSISGNIKIFEQGADVNNNYYIYYGAGDGSLHLGQRSASATNIDHTIAGTNFTTNRWYYLTITRSGSTFSTYINGLLSYTSTDADSVVDFAGSARLGAGIWEG